jgi:hypothetical protein
MAANLMMLTMAIWLFEAVVFLSVSDEPWRYSLRTLLVAMPTTALALGLIAALAGFRAS